MIDLLIDIKQYDLIKNLQSYFLSYSNLPNTIMPKKLNASSNITNLKEDQLNQLLYVYLYHFFQYWSFNQLVLKKDTPHLLSVSLFILYIVTC